MVQGFGFSMKIRGFTKGKGIVFFLKKHIVACICGSSCHVCCSNGHSAVLDGINFHFLIVCDHHQFFYFRVALQAKLVHKEDD
jgi:hypothetical protein